MTTIHKFAIHHTGISEVVMPRFARVISAHAQYNSIKIWAIVTPGQEMDARRFAVLVTGDNEDVGHGKYIGTVLLYDGEYVAHVFELE